MDIEKKLNDEEREAIENAKTESKREKTKYGSRLNSKAESRYDVFEMENDGSRIQIGQIRASDGKAAINKATEEFHQGVVVREVKDE